MAVVGEAHVLVKAITTGFESDLRRQLKGIAGKTSGDSGRAGETLGQAFTRGFTATSGNVFTKTAEAIRTMVPQADSARLAFRSMVRTGYTLGTALTTIVGGISALIGGLVVLVGAVGRATPAVAGLASAFLQMRLAISFATFAMGGIGAAVSAATKQNNGLGKSIAEIREEWQQLQFQAEEAALSEGRAALNLENALENLRRTADLPPNSAARREAQLAYDEAELAYRKAKDRTQDLNAEVAKGPQALNSGAAGSDPYAGLTESQAAFARFLVGIRPKLDVLKEAVASGFLPVMQTQIQALIDFYFPELEASFKRIGTALGQGTVNFADNFLDENTKKEVITFFDNLEKNLPTIGSIFGELGELLFKVFNDADGIGTKFLTWVLTTLEDWNAELEKNGLGDFFDNAYETGSQLFGIIGNIFNGLGDFFKILEDSGAIATVLDYLDKITGRFAALGDDEVAGALTGNLYAGLANNLEPVMDFLGLLVDSFLKIGANPAIGEAFEKLNSPENTKNWDSVFKAMADAGPALADLVVTIGEIMAGFADSEAPTAFFETINELIKPLAEWISNPDNKKIVDTIGKLFAQISAFTFVLGGVRFAIWVLFGNIAAIFGTLGTVFRFLKPILKGLGKMMLGLGKLMINAFARVAGFIRGIWPLLRVIGVIVQQVIIVAFKIFINVVKNLAIFIAKTALTIGRTLLSILGPWGLIIAAVIAGLTWFFTQTETGKKIWSDFMSFLKDLWDGLVDKFNMVAGFLKDLFDDPIGTLKNLWVGMMNFFIAKAEGFINFFIDGINGLIGKVNGGLGFLGDLVGQTFEIGLVGKVSLPRIPALALGGVVSPSPGGTLARVAEAGRPERIEPLDENGLSKRDKVLISSMGGSKGITVNVYPSPGMDERELANLVSRRLAFEIKKGTI